MRALHVQRIFYSCIVTTVFVCAPAQTPSPQQIKSDKQFYLSVYTQGFCSLHSSSTGQPLYINIPFVSKRDGNSTEGVYTEKLYNPLAKNLIGATFEGAEAGGYKQFFFFETSALVSLQHEPYLNQDVGGVMNLGYGRHFPLRIPFLSGDKWVSNGNKNYHHKLQGDERVVFSVSLAFSPYWLDIGLKHLDHYAQEVDILGKASADHFSISKPGANNSKTSVETSPTNALGFYYSSNGYALMPRVGIGSNPMKNRIGWRLNLWYYIPLFKESEISIQKLGDGGMTEEFIRMKLKNKENYFAQGAHVGADHFNLNGLFMGLMISWNLNSSK